MLGLFPEKSSPELLDSSLGLDCWALLLPLLSKPSIVSSIESDHERKGVLHLLLTFTCLPITRPQSRHVCYLYKKNSVPFSSRQPPSIKRTQDKFVLPFSVVLLYVAWKRGFPRKFALFVLFCLIEKRSFNLLCVLDLTKYPARKWRRARNIVKVVKSC